MDLCMCMCVGMGTKEQICHHIQTEQFNSSHVSDSPHEFFLQRISLLFVLDELLNLPTKHNLFVLVEESVLADRVEVAGIGLRIRNAGTLPSPFESVVGSVGVLLQQ